MGTIDFQDQGTFDRRIGRRVELDAIDVINVSWIVPRSGRFGRKKAPAEVAGRIEAVSLTGATITGPADLGLAPGDRAVVRCRGRDSVVAVRHAQPPAENGAVRYGVELTRTQPILKRRIDELLDPVLLSSLTHVAAPAFPAGDPPSTRSRQPVGLVSTPEPEPSPRAPAPREVFGLMKD